MKTLQELLYKVQLLATDGHTDKPVSGIAFDSRSVAEGNVFVATVGTQVDGHQYINKAIEKGATAIVCQTLPETRTEGITYVQVRNSEQALGLMASRFYDNPSAKMKVVGITGTNGKTTTVTLLYRLFRALGYNVGLLSTVQNEINGEVIPSTHTTPDAVQLNALMAEMVRRGCTHCFMEASSHAIVQHRIAGIQFAGAAFSNITHDHLDYHQTFDNYIKAKKQLFDELPAQAFALVNIDDKRGRVMVQNTKANIKTYSLQTMADFRARLISNSLHGLHLEINQQEVWFQLIGNFNAYNLLAVYGVAVSLGEDSDEVLRVLSSLPSAVGRFDRIVSANGITAIVDYAHTPDALQNVLETIAELRTGNEKVITIVGCGGNRDKTKRPIMAGVACQFSDHVILTSDNPRDEEPEDILAQMQAGVTPSNFRKTQTIIDREEAIRKACAMAAPHDIVLVAGKGHETYQEIKGVKYPFDDKKIIEAIFSTTL